MNKGRWVSIRLVARRSVHSAVDVSVILVSLPWRALTQLNLRPASKAGLLVERTVRKNWTACLEPRGIRPRAAEKATGTPGRGTHGQSRIQVASGRSTS